jgi:hypothetical protein
MATGFICTVNQAGPSSGAGTVQLALTDTNKTFSNTWFNAVSQFQNQILAVALAAISTQSQVNAWVDPPEAGTTTECYALYIIASLN